MSDVRKFVPRAQWLRRLASRRKDRRALVLSGGGPYGALQAGAIKALLEDGFAPDLIVGTSVGALNGAFVAADPTAAGAAKLHDVWTALTEEALFPGARRRSSWARMVMRGDRIFTPDGLSALIENDLPISTFEEAALPLGIVATDIETGRDVTFTTGALREPLLASAAMPGIYPPVEIEGRRYIDGGVANAVPIVPAVEMGGGRVVVINCSGSRQERRPLQRPMDHLLHAFLLARSQRYERDLETLAPKVEIVEVPLPSLGFNVPFTSMEYTELMLRLGHAAARRFLESSPLRGGLDTPVRDDATEASATDA